MISDSGQRLQIPERTTRPESWSAMIDRLRVVSFWALIALAIFQAVSAFAGGIGLIATGGLGMPQSFLDDGPFRSFVWPGLILIGVVGGSQGLAAGLLLARRESALLWSAAAGFGMIVWIFTETGMIRGMSWLQALYFATGIAQLVVVMALLGVASWFPRTSLSPASMPAIFDHQDL
ncbi:hypothetical protein [Microbacterium foliorum]|uniref:hypothetical protein n=1 Tax=Microbacterium foliorum TaxID=104336 RepID=UPI0028D2153F|nr:hypothetical protein [Microbacterium foliorum]